MQAENYDPYEGLETQEEREAVYQKLQEQYEKDLKAYNQAADKFSKDCSEAWEAMNKKCSQEESFFEKAVFTVAAGSFGVSFAFINQIIPLSTAVHKTLLVAAWLLFGICLICRMLDHLHCAVFYGRVCEDIRRRMHDFSEGIATPFKKGNPMWNMGVILDYLSFIVTSGGILCLTVFVYLNLST